MAIEWPNDPTELALIAQDADQPKGVRDEAVARLWPHAAQVVRSEGRRSGRYISEELLADVTREIVYDRLAKFNPAKGVSFLGFSRKVVHNLLIDDYRRKSRRREVAGEWEAVHAVDETVQQWQQDLLSPFSAADEERISTWDARIRLVLLVRGQVWAKASEILWARTLADCNVSAPFPPPGFPSPATHRECQAALQAALGESSSTIAQRWKRHKARLADLDFYRDYPEVRKALLED